ncbi:hypothetical protein NHQ30_008534 [Ciborinia camelliae]|nr:hypothetical protein NHQ30_008534 [Ciborinia camelliae]
MSTIQHDLNSVEQHSNEQHPSSLPPSYEEEMYLPPYEEAVLNMVPRYPSRIILDEMFVRGIMRATDDALGKTMAAGNAPSVREFGIEQTLVYLTAIYPITHPIVERFLLENRTHLMVRGGSRIEGLNTEDTNELQAYFDEAMVAETEKDMEIEWSEIDPIEDEDIFWVDDGNSEDEYEDEDDDEDDDEDMDMDITSDDSDDFEEDMDCTSDNLDDLDEDMDCTSDNLNDLDEDMDCTSDDLGPLLTSQK